MHTAPRPDAHKYVFIYTWLYIENGDGDGGGGGDGDGGCAAQHTARDQNNHLIHIQKVSLKALESIRRAGGELRKIGYILKQERVLDFCFFFVLQTLVGMRCCLLQDTIRYI